MDRNIVYPGAIPLETDVLQAQKNTMIGMAKYAGAILGTNTLLNGLACTPNSPAALNVLVAPGEIYFSHNIDPTAYGSLAADTTHNIIKCGISLDTVTLSTPAPVTAGQSINYLIQFAFSEADSVPVVLPYYNASNPAIAYSGPANSGATNNTIRQNICVVGIVNGASAATGTQVTPVPTSGYTGAYVVTVANGATTVVSGNISILSTAPFLPATGLAKGLLLNTRVFSTAGTFTYTPTLGTNKVIVEAVGGGGGSGGVAATSSSQCAVSSPGGSASYGKGIFTAAFSGVTITVGAGGAAGASGGGTGGNGGTSSFGALMSCPGGALTIGGTLAGSFPTNVVSSVASSSPSGANIIGFAGAGGSYVLCASSMIISGASDVTQSFFGAGPGSGAPGKYIAPSASSAAGWTGAVGTVIVHEYS